MIAESKKYQITNLTVTGTINYMDISFLREMAGLYAIGRLAKLDMTKCEIGNSVLRFDGCQSLETVLLPQKITKIEQVAFRYCSSISSVTIPNSVLSMDSYCFDGCTSLQNIILPNSLNSISEFAFKDCSKLESITIPSNVKSIGNGVFKGCTNLQEINVASDNLYYKSIQGVLFDKEETSLIQMPANSQILTYEIPASVKSLGHSAFDGCTQLKEIHCLPTTPPTITVSGFSSEVLNNCKLYIPKGSYNAYWIAQGWGDFKNIIEGDGSIDSAFIIGNWKLLTHNGQVATHVTFNNDGTFLYTSVNDGAYSEHGIYKIENNILYEKFSDEDTWCMSEIFTLNSIALTLRDLDEDGITYVGDSYTYQRVE